MFKSYFNNPSLEKTAFEISIDPATVLGAAVGLTVARHKGKKDAAKALKDAMSMHPQSTPAQVGYYQQVQNLDRDVQIVFTPLGVLYVLQDGPSELVIDSIDINDMSQPVKERYLSKDKAFFKNVMINKVRSDINLVERHFAGRMIDKQKGLGFPKQASEIDVFEEIKDTLSKIEKSAGEGSEYSGYLLGDEPIVVKAAFTDEIDINKVAGIFGEELKFPSFDGTPEDVQGKLDNPRYLSKESTVKYLPDRVLFIADGFVVAQLAIANMNEEGFKAFKNNDDQFFYRFFADQLGVRKPSIADLFKQASEATDERELFTATMVHPELYYLLLNERLTAEWLTLDPEMLVDAVEKEFGLEEPINDLVLNKIWSIQALNNPEGFVFKNVQAFEKMVRAMNAKTIDFADTERNISLGELAFALQVFQNVTPFSDVYDQFSEGVGHYMADVLAGQNRRLIDLEFTGTAGKLFKWLDDEVRDRVSDYLYEDMDDQERTMAINNDNLIAIQSRLLIKKLRDGSEMPDDFSEFVKAHWGELQPVAMVLGDDVENLITMVTRNIEENIAVDVFLKYRDQQLADQKDKFLKL